MPKAKIAITLDQATVNELDRLVRGGRYPNRSQAVEAAVVEKLARLKHRRLAEECAKLDPVAEQAMAEEGFEKDMDSWPKY